MTTPTSPITLEERVTILETRLETVLPTLATKEDIARLEGKIDADITRIEGKIDTGNERLEGKIDADVARIEGKIDASNERLEGKINAMENKLLIKFTGIGIALTGIAIAIVKYL